jgi:hypothetical protein
MILYVASILDQREKYQQLVLMMHGILMQDNKSSLVFVVRTLIEWDQVKSTSTRIKRTCIKHNISSKLTAEWCSRFHGILMQDNKSSLVFVAIVDLQDKIPL